MTPVDSHRWILRSAGRLPAKAARPRMRRGLRTSGRLRKRAKPYDGEERLYAALIRANGRNPHALAVFPLCAEAELRRRAEHRSGRFRIHGEFFPRSLEVRPCRVSACRARRPVVIHSAVGVKAADGQSQHVRRRCVSRFAAKLLWRSGLSTSPCMVGSIRR